MTLPERFLFSQGSANQTMEERLERLMTELESMYSMLSFSWEHQSVLEEWTPTLHTVNPMKYRLQIGRVLTQKHTKEFFFEVECHSESPKEHLILNLPHKQEKNYSLPLIGMVFGNIDGEVLWGSVLLEGNKGRIVATGNTIYPLLSGKNNYLQGNFKILLET